MTVFGIAAIDEAFSAANGGQARLVVAKGDLVTPLAREQAKDAGVEIVIVESRVGRESEARHEPQRQDRLPRPALRGSSLGAEAPPLPSPPSPAFYRRGAPVEPIKLPRGSSSARSRAPSSAPIARIERVVVVGAGHVGTITAMRLAESDLIDEIVLVDVADGLAEGMALDISHSASLLGFTTSMRGERTIETAGQAAYTVITAGKARQPGMSRGDLATTNAAIVGSLAREIARISPAGVILVVTNPLDEMTEHAWRVSGLPSSRVIGMAGVLDTARFASLVGQTGIARADEVHGLALGSHGHEMVIPKSLAQANGKPLAEHVDTSTLDTIIMRTRDSGAEVVGLLKSGSAFITPGLSAAQMVIKMIREDDSIISATVRPSGEYGIDGTYIGLPVRLGQNGLRSILEVELAPNELQALSVAAAKLTDRMLADSTSQTSA